MKGRIVMIYWQKSDRSQKERDRIAKKTKIGVLYWF